MGANIKIHHFNKFKFGSSHVVDCVNTWCWEITFLFVIPYINLELLSTTFWLAKYSSFEEFLLANEFSIDSSNKIKELLGNNLINKVNQELKSFDEAVKKDIPEFWD